MFTTNPMDIADSIFKTKDKTILVEIKHRNIKYLNYPTHIMEYKKLVALYEKSNKLKCDGIFYVNFFGDNDLIIYSQKAFNSASQTNMECKKTTAVNTGYINKDVLMLDSNLGQHFKKINEKWIKQ